MNRKTILRNEIVSQSCVSQNEIHLCILIFVEKLNIRCL